MYLFHSYHWIIRNDPSIWFWKIFLKLNCKSPFLYTYKHVWGIYVYLLNFHILHTLLFSFLNRQGRIIQCIFIIISGENAPLDELVDFIAASQIAGETKEVLPANHSAEERNEVRFICKISLATLISTQAIFLHLPEYETHCVGRSWVPRLAPAYYAYSMGYGNYPFINKKGTLRARHDKTSIMVQCKKIIDSLI